MLKNAPIIKLDFAKPTFVRSVRSSSSNLLKGWSQRVAGLFVVGAVVLSGCTSAGPFEPHSAFKQTVLPSGYAANLAPVSGFNGGAYNYNGGEFLPQSRFAPLQRQNGLLPQFAPPTTGGSGTRGFGQTGFGQAQFNQVGFQQNGFQPFGGFGGRLPSTPFRGAGVFNSGSC